MAATLKLPSSTRGEASGCNPFGSATPAARHRAPPRRERDGRADIHGPIRTDTHAHAVAPGWIDTPRLTRAFGPEKPSRIAAIARQLPGKSIGSPEQVAHAVLLLMTNGFMNGEILHIDGAGRHV